MQIIYVKVNDVELPCTLEDSIQHNQVMGYRARRVGIEAQRPFKARDQLSGGDGIAAGEQCNLMALAHQLFGEPGDDAFGASILLGRNTFRKWRNLSNPHSFLLSFVPLILNPPQ
jgi:hypothetical protein